MMYSSVHSWKDARIFFKEAQSLSKKYQVDFYAVTDDTASESFENSHLNIHLLDKAKRHNRYKIWRQLYKEILASDATYYHFHDPELLLLLPFLKRKKKTGKFIYDIHENFPKAIQSKSWIPKYLRKRLAKIVPIIEKKLLNQTDGILFAEESYKHDYQALSSKVLTEDIYNYPKIQNRTSVVPRAKQEPITFVYVGRIAEIRGIWEMLDMIRSLTNDQKNVRLKLVGSCENNLLEKVKQYIHRYSLENVVEYQSFVAYDQLASIYAQCDIGLCLLHPVGNYTESIATKMFEYMAHGLPMIVSNFPLWRSIIEQSKNGFAVDVRDSKEIVYAANQLVSSSLLREEQSKNGMNYLQKGFSWSSEEAKLYAFYQTLKEGATDELKYQDNYQ